MAGVRRTKTRDGRLHEKWRFWFIDHAGQRRWGTGTKKKADTLAVAKKLEEDHRQIRLGYRPVPKRFEKACAFAELVGEYLAWGEAQGGRGGRPWGRHTRLPAVDISPGGSVSLISSSFLI